MACVLVGLMVCCQGRGLFDCGVKVWLLGRLHVLVCIWHFWRAGGLFGIALRQGNGSRGLIRGSGERALVCSCSIILRSCVGSLVIFLVIRSRMDERFVGAVFWRCVLSFAAVF